MYWRRRRRRIRKCGVPNWPLDSGVLVTMTITITVVDWVSLEFRISPHGIGVWLATSQVRNLDPLLVWCVWLFRVGLRSSFKLWKLKVETKTPTLFHISASGSSCLGYTIFWYLKKWWKSISPQLAAPMVVSMNLLLLLFIYIYFQHAGASGIVWIAFF